jgi:general secretion pathway protein D
MIACNRLRGLAVFAAVLLLLPADTLQASTRKADKLVKLGLAAESVKDYDKALAYYEQALKLDPQDVGYQISVRRVRYQAGQAHVEAGIKLRTAGKLEEARVEFQKAFNIDTGSGIALQELQQTNEALELKRKGPPGATPLTSAEKARNDSLAMIESLQPVPELKPISNLIPQLKMNNQPIRVLYETVGKLAGINVLLDPQMQPGKNANLDLSNVTLNQALDYIGLLTKTFWKPISENAIFVTEDNVTKRRDYEDEVVKVFYLRNPTSVQEFQELVTTVRSVSDVRRMFTYNEQNAIVVRDTVDKVALVEKLLHDMDKPRAELLVDIIVLNANSDKSRQLGAGLVSGGTNGLSIPFAFSPTNPVVGSTTSGTTTTGTTTGTTTTTTPTTTTGTVGGAISLPGLAHLSTNDFSTTLPGAMLTAVMSDTQTKVMQSPEVRATDGQKVTLKIGDRVPYATGSFQPGVGTVGVSPLVSTQFQFIDTGVNLEMTPHVHGANEVTLHISVDISAVSSTVNLGGLNQPVISQNKNETDIRLRDGEVSLLAGLVQSQETGSINGIPGLVNMPILGKYLFGTTSKDKSRGELMIAIIPHIVRVPEVTGLDLRGISAGTDQTVKLSYGPRKQEPAPAAAPPAPAAPAAPAATAPAVPTAPVVPATPAGPAPPVAAGGPRLSFVPPASQAQLSAPVVVVLQIDNASDLAEVPIKVKWDPKILRLNQVTPAGLLAQSGTAAPPSEDIRNDSGDASIDIHRAPGAAGVNGSGALMQFTFTAIGKGATSISVTEASLKDSKQQAITVVPPTLPVTVQ